MSESRTGIVSTVTIVLFGVAMVAASQCVATPEAELAITFLQRVRAGDRRASELATDAVAAGLERPDATLVVIRTATDFANVGVSSVGWGERCIEVDAVGTTITRLHVAISEEHGTFRVSGLTLDGPDAGPCSDD